jgi:multiple sugar transport system ATP-binding protein
MSTLQLKAVEKKFGKTTVIHGVNLEAAHGEFVVFVGPSGCGKSTLLRIIAGLETATAGEVLIDNENVVNVSAAHRGCAMVFQSYALYPHMSVYANMAFGLENLKIPAAQIKQKVSEAAKLLRLDELLERRPTQLSGGQRQRVAIGRAIVREPKIFLFDEPLSNLDAELRVSMRAELRDLHRRLGSTMIYVTHDQVEAMTLADKIVVLRAGRVEQIGTPQGLYDQPINTFVAGFIGSPRMNFIERGVFEKWPMFLAQLPQKTHQIGIRPEHFHIATQSDHPSLTMKISHAEYMGGTQLLRGATESGAQLEAVLPTAMLLGIGQTVTLQFDPKIVHTFELDGKRCA